MYVIGLIVYGLNLNHGEFAHYEKVKDLLRSAGVASGHYNGPGEEPCWIGENFDNIDECEDVLLDAEFFKKLEVTDDLKEEFDIAKAAVFKFLDSMTEQDLTDEGFSVEEVQSFRELISTSEAKVWLLWGSS